jgi:hypothetical protein
MSWTPPTFGLPVTYRVEIFDGPQKIRDEQVSAPPYSTPALQQGKTYTVNVYARTTVKESAALSGSQNVCWQPPAAGPPTILSGRELGGDVLPQISPPARSTTFASNGATSRTARAPGRRRPSSTASTCWARGSRACPWARTGSTWHRPIRSASTRPRRPSIDITVTSDANAFINEPHVHEPGRRREHRRDHDRGRREPPLGDGGHGRPVERRHAVAAQFRRQPVSSYHASGTSKFQGEIWDLGSSISARGR